MINNQDWSDIFAPNGHILREGELIHRANLSRTLGVIAREGADGFYKVRSPASPPVPGVTLSVGPHRGRDCEQGSGDWRDSHT